MWRLELLPRDPPTSCVCRRPCGPLLAGITSSLLLSSSLPACSSSAAPRPERPEISPGSGLDLGGPLTQMQQQQNLQSCSSIFCDFTHRAFLQLSSVLPRQRSGFPYPNASPQVGVTPASLWVGGPRTHLLRGPQPFVLSGEPLDAHSSSRRGGF